MRNTKLLKFLGTLNILLFLFEFVWAMFVILIYANPSVPSIVLSGAYALLKTVVTVMVSPSSSAKISPFILCISCRQM